MISIIGSARHDEHGKLTGGKAGDQLQKDTINNDVNGEVSLQPMYTHSKGWYIIRPKSFDLADRIAYAMLVACNNKNIGYSQSASRSKPVDVTSDKPINTDCSMLIRACLYNAIGVDSGNFSTQNEVAVLNKTGLFMPKMQYVSETKTPVYIGDVLVTTMKGHTAIVVGGINRRNLVASDTNTYYPPYKGSSSSITEALKGVGEKDVSRAHRKALANANSISNYKGTASQNLTMVKLLKAGRLIKV